MVHRFSLFLIICSLCSGCIVRDTKLYGNTGFLYGGAGQSVTGDEKSVSVFNIWSTSDGLPLAEQHCAKYGRSVSSSYQIVITGYYQCGGLLENKFLAASSMPIVKTNKKKVSRCLRSNVVLLDDLRSDAKTIAEGVVETCADSFEQFYMALIKSHEDSPSFTIIYINSLKEEFRKSRISRVLPYVLTWRQEVRNGWDRNSSPTEKELPDKLVGTGI